MNSCVEPMHLPSCSQCALLASSSSSCYVGVSLRNAQLPTGHAGWSCRSLVVRSEKADFWQLLGGRGLPGGEEALIRSKQLYTSAKESPKDDASSSTEHATATASAAASAEPASTTDESFDKEMMGLTGGFPGGEMGLNQFVSSVKLAPKPVDWATMQVVQQRPKAPPPPLLMPGMTVIVKNERNRYHMFGGIVQRVTDGKVAVLFEGGNWDKLVTFYIEELERTAKGPPMTHPKSHILVQEPPSS
ncbi:hypothetical protein L7F22_007063 [Adiantum nelumboides]|nr:hypothetical protein [Adiantum nelumboides]